MTIMKEIVHLAVKDARRAKWYLLAFMTVLVLLAFDEFLDVTALPAAAAFLKLGLVGVAMLTVVVVVQEDSPISAESYWTSKPISPARLAISKLLLLGVTFILSVAAVELILVARSGLLIGGSIAPMLIAAATFALYLVGTAVIAANTRSVPSAAIAALAVAVAVILTLIMVTWSYTIMTPLMQRTLIIAGGLGALTSFVWLYVGRDNRRAPSVLAALSVYAGSLALVLEETQPQLPESVPLLISQAPFVIDSVSGIPDNGVRLNDIHLSPTAGTSERFLLSAMRLDISGPAYGEGWEYDSRISRRLSTGDPQLIRRTDWLNADPSRSEGELFQSPGAYIKIKEGVKPVAGDTLTYAGRVDKLQPRVIFEIPVAQETESVVENSRIRITTSVDESSRPVIELVVRSLGTPMQKSGPLISGSDISYVLFNEARNEAVFLQPQMTHVKAEPVITPLLTHGQYRYRFPIDSATLAGMPDPQAWAKQSRLAVVAWERVESWPVEYVHIMR